MAVSCVHLEADAYLVCLTHALSTEREEVMGLLIGEVDERKVSHVSAVIMLRRSDKQADRVEISPEQLSDASTKAEDLAKELQRPMRVLGWYHSHPTSQCGPPMLGASIKEIQVFPLCSQEEEDKQKSMNVRTQASYQLMDPGFIGLIFSVFNEDKNTKQNRVQVTSFQSVSRGGDYGPLDYDRIEIPLHVVPSTGIGRACLESLVNLPKILSLEEQEAYQNTEQHDLDLLTKIHNAAVYTKSECHIMDVMGGPLLQSLENRLEMNKVRMEQLKHRKEEIKKRMKALSTT